MLRSDFMTSKTIARPKIKKFNKKMADDVLNNFDFEKAHRIMVSLDWKWSPLGAVPSISEMKKTAFDCLNTVVEGDCVSCATGGFMASIEEDDHQEGLRLDFNLTTFTSWEHR